MTRSLLSAFALLLSSSPALAGQIDLPSDLEWCAERSAVEAALGEFKSELDDDMLDAQKAIWGLDGFITAVLDEDKLVKVRVRFFETDKAKKKVLSTLSSALGDGAESGSRTRWNADDRSTIEHKVASEQIFVTFEIPWEVCTGGATGVIGQTEQEKADLEAIKKRKAIEFDPYAVDDDPDTQIVEKKVDKKKEAEEKKKEQEAKDLDDEDIDW